MIGFKWYGDDGKVLYAVGLINDPDLGNEPEWVVTTLTLKHNQRLVGVRSGSYGEKQASHYSF